MTIQSAIDAELPNLRAEAEARMTSRCTIRRQNGYATVDGMRVPNWDDIHADLPCRIGGANTGSSGFRNVTVGQTETQVAVRVASFPASTSDLHDRDMVLLTAGENEGGVLQIVEASWHDQATARRVPVVEAQRPEEWT